MDLVGLLQHPLAITPSDLPLIGHEIPHGGGAHHFDVRQGNVAIPYPRIQKFDVIRFSGREKGKAKWAKGAALAGL